MSDAKRMYAIKYNINIGQFSAEDLEESESGGCDSLGIISVIGKFGDGKQLSTLPVGFNPDGKPWDDNIWFEVFGLLAAKLATSKEISESKRLVAEMVHEIFKEAKGAKRNAEARK